MFASLLKTINEIEAAVKAGDYEAAARQANALLGAVIDLVYGPKVMGDTPSDHVALEAAVHSCVAACHAANAPKAAGEPVGKLGDGTILKLLIQLLPYILPLIPK